MTESSSPSRKFKTLKNAPITEALIDIQAVLPATTTLSVLESYGVGIESLYPKTQKRFSLTARFEVGQGEAHIVAPPSSPDGFLFHSPDNGTIVQARLDGFTLSKLKPYDDWVHFVGLAKELWVRYVEIAAPISVTRVAVRYLNRIEIPVGVNIRDYLKTAPQIGSEIPQNLASFLMRLVIPDTLSPSIAIVTETTAPDSNDKIYPVILDIDAFRVIELSPTASEIWNILEELRDYKNTIFFETLTDVALKVYQ